MSSRLTPERTDELYAAVLRLLTELGYDKLTMDRIAEETRSSKATLYRQWGSKEALVVAAFDAHAPEVPSVVETGSLRGDFLALYRVINEVDPDIALAGAVLHACQTHPTLAESLHDRVIASRVGVVDEVLRRAVARGEIDPDNPAIPFLVPTLVGPAMVRELIERKPADMTYLAAFLDAVILPALGITTTP
ncbi:TetR/AcrR family transcriptional regulator [Mumia quercus]|uniref:TetR/AcrR family transcriptional regulator n=1 Tax=Mumia quercus TaxID=2976125 RepID=UPI0021D3102B|nr:TetR/AcrR family transcriptional regulator [Mumia quercus]